MRENYFDIASYIASYTYIAWMIQKGTTLDHDFYVVVQKMRTQVTNTISLYKITNALLLLIFLKLVMKSIKVC